MSIGQSPLSNDPEFQFLPNAPHRSTGRFAGTRRLRGIPCSNKIPAFLYPTWFSSFAPRSDQARQRPAGERRHPAGCGGAPASCRLCLASCQTLLLKCPATDPSPRSQPTSQCFANDRHTAARSGCAPPAARPWQPRLAARAKVDRASCPAAHKDQMSRVLRTQHSLHLNAAAKDPQSRPATRRRSHVAARLRPQAVAAASRGARQSGPGILPGGP